MEINNLKIRKRSLLVGLISMATLGCLLVGLLFYSGWLHLRIQSVVYSQVLNDNIQTAKQLNRLIDEMGIGDIREHPESWERLQSVVEDIELPNEGFVCVVDQDSGLLLCHPAMRQKPELRNVPVGKCAINIEGEDTDIVSAISDNNFSATGGVAYIKGETQVVAVGHIKHLNANVLVHQRASGISSAISRVMTPVNGIGIFVAFLIAGLVYVVAYAIAKRYENKLAAINENLEEQVAQRTRSLMKTRNAVIFGLAKLAESRDTDTGEHLERICAYVTLLATALNDECVGFDPLNVEHLALASSLHDIGKVGIPDSVLLKPGKFLPEERSIMEGHAELGGSCLLAIQNKLGDDDFLALATEIALFHHEKWDGTGYPAQLTGTKIPLSARIVALADVYDALTTKRPYKAAMSHQKAKKIILEGCGSHFDPRIVEAFIRCEQQFQEIAHANQSESLTSIEKQISQLRELASERELVQQEDMVPSH